MGSHMACSPVFHGLGQKRSDVRQLPGNVRRMGSSADVGAALVPGVDRASSDAAVRRELGGDLSGNAGGCEVVAPRSDEGAQIGVDIDFAGRPDLSARRWPEIGPEVASKSSDWPFSNSRCSSASDISARASADCAVFAQPSTRCNSRRMASWHQAGPGFALRVQQHVEACAYALPHLEPVRLRRLAVGARLAGDPLRPLVIMLRMVQRRAGGRPARSLRSDAGGRPASASERWRLDASPSTEGQPISGSASPSRTASPLSASPRPTSGGKRGHPVISGIAQERPLTRHARSSATATGACELMPLTELKYY